jgi:tetratricopeptide (TPR) repeat protein
MCCELFSQTPTEIFEKANEDYQKGDYKSAIIQYNIILEQGFESGELLYNLGNAHFKIGEFAPAIVNYERAKKILGHNKELEHNLALVNYRLKDKIEPVPQLFIVEWWDNIKNLFTISSYQFFIFFIFVIFIISITLFFWYKNYILKKRMFLVSVVIGVVFVFFVTAFTFKVIEEKNNKFAVLFLQELKVKSSPDESGTAIFQIHYGTKFQILDELGEWYKILIPDGKNGWIKKQGFEII